MDNRETELRKAVADAEARQYKKTNLRASAIFEARWALVKYLRGEEEQVTEASTISPYRIDPMTGRAVYL